MSEYWKSTPSYWCKFCSQYVRDTGIERKNHEASARHQNNIQRSLRQLHKDKQIEEREKQRAKDEVARLNGMFGDGKNSSSSKQPSAPAPKHTATAPPQLSTAAQRKAHAEQLAALGVELPDELKKEVTGVGNYQVVNQHAVEVAEGGSISVNRSLAEILAESKKEAEETEDKVKTEEEVKATAQGVYKRKLVEDEEDIRDEEAAPKRKAWGSNLKTYPGSKDIEEDVGDLDALLGGVKRKREPEIKPEDGEEVKKEEGDEAAKPISAVPDVAESGETAKKAEACSYAAAAPAVVFKKRKGKR
ncbi:hypothetical protein M409DRAFT_27874 [Zasmidium cellare ATCC 36951]|uniref:Matrin-type domain-containing protein n=1 Tax=Zasmidium cellare ATCC 36951 TaxID=1080233 RepID=A0A6A6C6E3_ZASCE|nr:uncharacterized protein M409DRAFT_27874 [Zasmidium cellare ATCC 36951]KAF2161818.1 hypothetical protein M409DRAFT_27874 [Zasmidium cellare ATCC 36951]